MQEKGDLLSWKNRKNDDLHPIFFFGKQESHDSFFFPFNCQLILRSGVEGEDAVLCPAEDQNHAA